jgi:putative ABC transport system ATP-binding protein
MRSAIQAWGLSRCHQNGSDARQVLNGVGFCINQGEFVAITGPSGSGKSTLLNQIGLLDEPSSGRLQVLGREVSELSDDERAKIRGHEIGFVFQSYQLLPRRSVLDNVALPGLYQGLSISTSHQRAKEVLASVGLAGFEQANPCRMSGGEQQRVAIARALFSNPALLLADEPTGALDHTNSALILDLLQQVCGHGRTLVVVTHDLAAAVTAIWNATMGD